MLRLLSARIRRFLSACGGNVAVLYALALVPVTLASSGGIDYVRAVMVRSTMSAALDAAALAVAQSKGLTDTQMQALAQQYFNANYHQAADCATPTVSISKSGQNILVSASCPMPTTILQLIGMDSITVNTSSTVTYGQTKLWVSLVLDNSHSMYDTDSSGLSKISALKSASHSLLTMLQNAGTNPGDVQVAIVPFTNDVTISKTNTTWIDWTYWDAKIGSCNMSGKTDAASCKGNGTWTSNWWGGSCNISGYNTKSSCEKAVAVWTPSAHSNWKGCVTDRGAMSGPDATYNYDVMNSSPVSGQPNSLFSADLSSGCPQAIMGLNYSWSNLGSAIDAMTPPMGSTNQTIGLMWGWHSLSQGAPLNPPALPDQTQRVIIILSDGFNTKDRWWGDGYNHSPEVDDRMAKVCANAKADGIVIYAVFVDINGAQGNSSVLQNCATDVSKYYDLTNAGDIQKAFNDIGQQITNLRVSQ